MIYLLMALVVLMTGALLWAPGLRRCTLGEPSAELGRQYDALKAFVLVMTGIWCYVAIQTGARLDYEWYLLQWDVVLQGEESPWVAHALNAYGPAYNLIAPLTLLDLYFPKILFVFAWSWVTAFLVGQVIQRGGSVRLAWGIAIGMLFSPYFATLIVHYGYFDIVPAGLCLFAVHMRTKNRDGLAGAALAVAVLMKFYPIALLPFLMLDGRRLRIRIAVWCVGLFILGMLSSYLYWGESTWRPLMFAAERPSRWLSIFMFLRGPYSPLGMFMDNPNVDYLTVPSIIFFGGVVWLTCWWKRVEMVPACIAGMATGLQFYKVGHVHFLMIVVVLIAYWVALGGCSIQRNRQACIAAAVSVLWWSLFIVIWAVMRRVARPSMSHLHDPASLIAFSQTVWLVLAMMGCRDVEQKPAVVDSSPA